MSSINSRSMPRSASLKAIADWFWSDPERHRRGRHDLVAARCEIIAHVLHELGAPDETLA
ncbi:MAG: hypothetical protein GX458_01065, partial [Phyllobacteriaceae bacterium]|nr:hypothetical protein [Phyllobacteriaceae bacterium]